MTSRCQVWEGEFVAPSKKDKEEGRGLMHTRGCLLGPMNLWKPGLDQDLTQKYFILVDLDPQFRGG